ncbi:conserved hypothetical protein [Perkinsus marinus ATCC 50983]|uniref:SDE2-like domain-containing protein n=1 Tax=Perkinsus marinus (strain ATCC 50983 / TXsc) TaxID=423536 RepID=C5LV54_PERM5|nr:conserved hypothetical protein [Perkinsus marinus ATCC 50983]EEQ99387.1 conserved hypothetical protein [Perkinsus marinus ATCC 50983]|eukprot:XP_002766670.1 conserved hypothetical protein [Perkinsus marinus ATCC 50983]
MSPQVLLEQQGREGGLFVDCGDIVQNGLVGVARERFGIPEDVDFELRYGGFIGGAPVVTVAFGSGLAGGKGGFGSLLKGQKGRGKKTTNFDACRDLDGRRIRHSRMTERIQAFEERQREDDELVAALKGPEEDSATKATRKAVEKEVKLDKEYTKALKESGRDRSDLIRKGLKNSGLTPSEAIAGVLAPSSSSSSSSSSRPKRAIELEKGESEGTPVKKAAKKDSMARFDAMLGLDGSSDESSDDDDDEEDKTD